MSKPTAEAGRSLILKISEQLFTEHGYNAVSIRDISQACNLTKAALYYHFPSKDALYAEVIDKYAHRLKQEMWEAGQIEGSTVDRLVAILSEYVRLTGDTRPYMSRVYKTNANIKKNTAHHTHQRFLKAILDPVDNILREAIQTGEISNLTVDLSPASLLVGMVNGMIMHQKLEGNLPGSSANLRTVVEIFWRGLTGEPSLTTIDDVEQYVGVLK